MKVLWKHEETNAEGVAVGPVEVRGTEPLYYVSWFREGNANGWVDKATAMRFATAMGWEFEESGHLDPLRELQLITDAAKREAGKMVVESLSTALTMLDKTLTALGQTTAMLAEGIDGEQRDTIVEKSRQVIASGNSARAELGKVVAAMKDPE